MIKIEIEAANGAEAREQLMALLGNSTKNLTTTFSNDDRQFALHGHKPIEEKQEEQSVEIKDLSTEAVAEGIKEVTKKRRTKAEIEADNAAKATPAETPAAKEPANEEKSEVPATEEQVNKPSVEAQCKELQTYAVTLARSGKREAGQKILAKYGAKSFTAAEPLAVKDYEAALVDFKEAVK